MRLYQSVDSINLLSNKGPTAAYKSHQYTIVIQHGVQTIIIIIIIKGIYIAQVRKGHKCAKKYDNVYNMYKIMMMTTTMILLVKYNK